MIVASRSALLRTLLLASVFTLPTLARASNGDAGSNAAEVMTHAKSQAAAEHKNILLMFGASW